jgi:hypothetical protein
MDTAEDVSQLTADLVDVLDAGKRTVSDIITTTRVFKSIPNIKPKDEEEFRILAQVNAMLLHKCILTTRQRYCKMLIGKILLQCCFCFFRTPFQ